MLTLGQYHMLRIKQESPEGLLLTNKSGDEVLMPNSFVDKSMSIGDHIEVLVYKDGNQEIIATTEEAKITLGQFAYLRVKEVNEVGAFCDWGTSKDLLIHPDNQLEPLEEGYSYVVYLYLDESTNRLEGTTILKPFLNSIADDTIYKRKEVEILVYDRSELGYQVIIDQNYEGLIYLDECDASVRIGHTLKGYVKPLREDGKIDISIKPFGAKNIEPNANIIWEKLEADAGFLPFTDKSSPEDIKTKFGMSKKLFKKALGSLYRQKMVMLKPDGIYKVE